MTTAITQHEGKKYLRRITAATDGTSIDVDVYAVLVAFGVTCPARQHAIKKLLAAGERGKGDAVADLRGAAAAVNRAIELAASKAPKDPTPPEVNTALYFATAVGDGRSWAICRHRDGFSTTWLGNKEDAEEYAYKLAAGTELESNFNWFKRP